MLRTLIFYFLISRDCGSYIPANYIRLVLQQCVALVKGPVIIEEFIFRLKYCALLVARVRCSGLVRCSYNWLVLFVVLQISNESDE